MRRFDRLAVTGIAAGAVLLGLMAGTSAAAGKPVKTSVKIVSTSATKFTGKVTSPKKACEKGREVVLYRQSSSRLYGGLYPGYERQGSDITDANGNWEMEAAEFFSEGTFRAAVLRKRIFIGGQKLVCSPVWGAPTPA